MVEDGLMMQLVVLYTPNLAVTTMIQLKNLPNVVLKKVPAIANPYEKSSGEASWVGSGYTKMLIWTLQEYDILFYLDADCLVVDSSVLDAFYTMM